MGVKGAMGVEVERTKRTCRRISSFKLRRPGVSEAVQSCAMTVPRLQGTCRGHNCGYAAYAQRCLLSVAVDTDGAKIQAQPETGVRFCIQSR